MMTQGAHDLALRRAGGLQRGLLQAKSKVFFHGDERGDGAGCGK
jgi:hypothetical protein